MVLFHDIIGAFQVSNILQTTNHVIRREMTHTFEEYFMMPYTVSSRGRITSVKLRSESWLIKVAPLTNNDVTWFMSPCSYSGHRSAVDDTRQSRRLTMVWTAEPDTSPSCRSRISPRIATIPLPMTTSEYDGECSRNASNSLRAYDGKGSWSWRIFSYWGRRSEIINYNDDENEKKIPVSVVLNELLTPFNISGWIYCLQ